MSIEIKTWEWVVETPRGMGGIYPHIVAVPDNLLFLKRGASISWQVYDINKKKWEPMSDLPESYDATGTLFDYDSYHKLIWYVPAGGSKMLYSYSPANDAWRSYPPAPNTIGDGAVVLWGGEGNPDYVYVLRGSHGADFWRFSISSQKWEVMRTPPFLPSTECTGFRKGGRIYVCPNPTIGAIFEYDPSIGLWATKTYTSLYSPAFLVVDEQLVAFSEELVEIFDAGMAKKALVVFGVPPAELPRPRHPSLLPPPFPTTPTRQFDILGDYIYAVTGYGAEGSIFRLEKRLVLLVRIA